MVTFTEEVQQLFDAVEIYLKQTEQTIKHAAVHNIKYPNTNAMDAYRKKVFQYAKSVRDMSIVLRRRTKSDKDLADHFKYIAGKAKEFLI